MLLTWIIMLFQITSSYCSDLGEEQAKLLLSTFHYNFQDLPNVGDVVVWTISSGNSEVISAPEIYKKLIPRLETNNMYLIFAQTGPHRFNTYYWIGQMAPLKDKKLTARLALLQYGLFNEYMKALSQTHITKMCREEEFIESESFWNTINFVKRISGKGIHCNQYPYVDEYLPSMLPVLYIVKGTNDAARIKEVPLGTQWLKTDICLVLEIGCKMEELSNLTFCGPNASTSVRESTKNFGRDVENSYTYTEDEIEEPLYRDELKFKSFLELLEDINHFNPHEIDDSQDQLKDSEVFVFDRDNDVSLYKIYESSIEKKTLERGEFHSEDNFQMQMQKSRRSYLFDTASISGLFFFLHYNEKLDVLLNGIEMVEDYIHKNYTLASKPIRMRVVEYWESVNMNIDYQMVEID